MSRLALLMQATRLSRPCSISPLASHLIIMPHLPTDARAPRPCSDKWQTAIVNTTVLQTATPYTRQHQYDLIVMENSRFLKRFLYSPNEFFVLQFSNFYVCKQQRSVLTGQSTAIVGRSENVPSLFSVFDFD